MTESANRLMGKTYYNTFKNVTDTMDSFGIENKTAKIPDLTKSVLSK
jgi:hypothetical protein